MDNNISLKIYCGSQAKGFDLSPIVSIGKDYIGFKPIVPSLSKDQESWVLLHSLEYTQYEMCLKDISYEGQPGIAAICLLIPKGMKLAFGEKPMDILIKISEQFKRNSLMNGQLPTASVSTTPYDELLDNLKLENLSHPLPVMRGNAPKSVGGDLAKLSNYMTKSDFNALGDVSHLELGQKCVTTFGSMNNINPMVSGNSHSPFDSGLLANPGDDKQKHDHKSGSKFSTILLIAIGALVLIGGGLYLGGLFDGPLNDVNDEIEETNLANNATITDQPEEIVPATPEEVPVAEPAEEPITEELATPANVEKPITTTTTESPTVKKQEPAKPVAQDPEWMEKFKSIKCPLALHQGAEITKVTVNSNNVSFTIKYSFMSKGDISESDRKVLDSDYNKIKDQYYTKGVTISVNQIDCDGKAI